MESLLNHLIQSTIVALLIAALCAVLHAQPARLRYILWMAASIKFLIPSSLLQQFGTRAQPVTAASPISATTVEQLTIALAPVSLPQIPQQTVPVNELLITAWLLGALFITTSWFMRWLRLHRTMREARPTFNAAGIQVFECPSGMEPGVFGILNPKLMLPAGILDKLTANQLDAVLAHELAHIKRKDNLTAAIHMAISATFWFHPLVWWIGTRLVEERERACDEAVLEQGNSAETYAHGILNVCRHYVESELPCAAGVGGADLEQRLRLILTGASTAKLSRLGATALLAAALFAFTLPICIGFLRAQTLPPPPQYKFDVASIRKSDPNSYIVRLGPGPQGGIRTENTNVLTLIYYAYDLAPHQVIGGPDWILHEGYNVVATPESPEEPGSQLSPEKSDWGSSSQRQRMQALLMERFRLVLKTESRDMTVYALTIGKNGHKLKENTDPNSPLHLSTNRGNTSGNNIPVKYLARTLTSMLRAPVLDETGLNGKYNFLLKLPAEVAFSTLGEGDIFTAIQEQLGLKLQAKRGTGPVFVIERIERPTEN